jgi:hypothetical protein
MLWKILGITFVLIAVLAIYVLVKTPKSVKISRSLIISATSEMLYPYISRPVLIQKWNPFLSADPDAKVQFFGPDSGVGAAWSWVGPKAGKGKATLIECEHQHLVKLRLEFEKPFKATNQGEYALKAQGNQTEVQWVVYETALIPRVISLFLNLDKLVGGLFEKGLILLKAEVGG